MKNNWVAILGMAAATAIGFLFSENSDRKKEVEMYRTQMARVQRELATQQAGGLDALRDKQKEIISSIGELRNSDLELRHSVSGIEDEMPFSIGDYVLAARQGEMHYSPDIIKLNEAEPDAMWVSPYVVLSRSPNLELNIEIENPEKVREMIYSNDNRGGIILCSGKNPDSFKLAGNKVVVKGRLDLGHNSPMVSVLYKPEEGRVAGHHIYHTSSEIFYSSTAKQAVDVLIEKECYSRGTIENVVKNIFPETAKQALSSRFGSSAQTPKNN